MNDYDYASYDELTGMNRYLVDLRESRMERYLADPKDLMSRINSEAQTRDDYSGREILELLQNAVDASREGDRVVVELEGEVLRVGNNGEAFTEGGIDSILIPNLSPKNEFENLGNKGLGFRSLLNGSEYIIVQSESLSMRMGLVDAREYAQLKGLAQRPPILAVPRVIEPLAQREFVTLVKCKLRDADFTQQIEKQIRAIDSRSMIFLPKIAEIELKVNDWACTIRKTSEGEICRVEVREGERTTERRYYLAKKTLANVDTGNVDDDGQKIRKDVHIMIARDLDDARELDQRWDYIYNAFPTKVSMPTGWIVNANFGVNADRNAINAKTYNWQALTGAVDLMFDEAEKLTQRECSFAALETLMGNYEKFNFEFAGASLKEYFVEKLLRAKLLPGVNGNYLSLAEKPFFYRENLTQYLQGEGFENTVKYCDKDVIDKLMQKYISSGLLRNYRRMSCERMSELINVRLDQMTVSEQIDLSVLFMKEYERRDEHDVKPNFFVEHDGQRINYRAEKYTETEKSVAKNVPDFLQIKFVKKEYIEEVYRRLEILAKDFEASEYAKYYNIKRYRLLNIARSYKAAVQKDAKKAQGYLCWLYENEVLPEKIREEGLGDVAILAKNGGTVGVDNGIFPGGLYEELFPASRFVIEEFGDGSEDWKKFLSGVGVREFPEYFGWDLTREAFRRILEQKPFARVRRLLNSQLWISQDATARESLNQAKWLEYEGKKYAPQQVILDEEYGQSFENVIGVNKEALQETLKLMPQVFEVLEVRRSITEMPIAEIYAILMQLPEKDRRGKLAKRIYRSLVNPREFAVENRDFRCANYDAFVQNGKVFCKDGHYHPVRETVYFAKGLLPSAALKDRNLIEVDKKRGAEKVKKLFGVERLQVDFHVEQFEQHSFQQQFAEILTTMKIGILATEKMELAEESKRDIKSLKIKLCRMVNATFNGEVKALEDYEFAPRKDVPSEYCIKIPEAGQCFDEVRYRPKFVNALTEMFVMRIGTGYAEENSDSIALMVNAGNVKGVIELQERGSERYREAAEFMGALVELDEQDGADEDEIYERNLQAVKSALEKYEVAYLKNMYARLMRAPMMEQMKFESLRNEFLNHAPDEEIVRDDFDAEECVLEYFAIREDIENDMGEANWRQAVAEFGEELNYHDDWKSLVRFGHFDEVRKLVAECRQRELELQREPEQQEEIPTAKVVTRVQSVATQRKSVGGGMRRGGFGGGGIDTDYLSYIGRRGQQIVLKHLREHGYLDVEDWSGEAIREGTNVNASDSYGYDITCRDQEGVKHYIEVKSHANRVLQIKFEMSRNQFEEAGKLSRKEGCVYEIYVVDGVDARKGEEPEIQVLNFSEIEGKMSPEKPKKYYYAG